MKKVSIICYCILQLTVFKAFSSSDSVFVFKDKQNSTLIGKSLFIYTDKENNLSLSQVIQQPQNFIQSKIDVPNLSITPYTYWLRFTIKNATSEKALQMVFPQPFLNEVILYSPQKNGKYNVQQLGDNFPYYYRDYKYPNFVFKIDVEPGALQTFYLKVKSDEQILVPLKVGTPSIITEELHSTDLFFGIYAGIILSMLLYNFFVYFSVRDKIYLKYVVYIFFIGFTQACILGYPFELIWPNYPVFANLSIYLFSCGVGITSLEFFKPFLQTKIYAPKLHKFSYVITGLYAITAVFSLTGFMHLAYVLVLVNAAIVSTYMMIVGFKVLSKGYKPARFFLIAWSSLLVGIFVFVLKDFGLLPYNQFTSYTMPIGSALETLLLSFALADRINILKKEKEISQAEALKISEENQKLIGEQNIILEQKVHERTLELEGANLELNHTLNNLKDAQTQLVNAEKMASLGQLTAGIAHEINNPINFVSSNLKPLKLDIEEILQVVKKYESINPKLEIESQLLEIEKLKKKIDLNYLKTEIHSLLNGIEDGARRTTEIVSGLRNFSRLDESQINFANINEGIDSTLVIVRSSIPHKVEVITEYAELPLVECYAGKINQVFMNILTNAIFAIKQKESMSNEKIIIKTYLENDLVCASFTDTGLGMTEEVKQKIFEPFFTTKGVGEGTGLGMSIVFKIVESHHAILEIESELGKGTTFILKLHQILNLPS